VDPLAPIRIASVLADKVARTNFNLFWIDGQYTIRVARIRGTFPRHRHPGHDEAWLVLDGGVRIDAASGTIELRAGDAVLIPAGLAHSPTALEEDSTVAIVNAREFRTEYLDGDDHGSAGYVERDLA
jgi:mannose-6-phosphate isomerase-like protein (cupin superfamily)